MDNLQTPLACLAALVGACMVPVNSYLSAIVAADLQAAVGSECEIFAQSLSVYAFRLLITMLCDCTYRRLDAEDVVDSMKGSRRVF
jgi:hypothetical protein